MDHLSSELRNAINILIIGGSGHVSRAVAQVALAKGYSVWTITRGHRALPKNVKSLMADRHDNNALEAVVTSQEIVWDMVIDCICYDLPDIRQDIKLFRYRARHFVLISTDFVYDHIHRSFPQPEETNRYVTDRQGLFTYGRKKRLCEQELIDSDTGDMDWTIVRPCHIYGPTSELGCLPLHARDPDLIKKLRSGRPLQLVGGGHFLQQPILADDLAETIVSLGGNNNARGRVFNVAGPDVIESWQYYQIIADVLGFQLAVEEVPVKTYVDEHPDAAPFLCHRIYNLSRLKTSGLTIPSTPIAQGLRLHIEGLLARRKSAMPLPDFDAPAK